MKVHTFLAIVAVSCSAIVGKAQTVAEVKVLSQQQLMDAMESYQCGFEESERKFLVEYIKQMPEEKQEKLLDTLDAIEPDSTAVNISVVAPLLHIEDFIAIGPKLADNKDPILKFLVNYRLAKTGDAKAAKRIHDLIHSDHPLLLHKQFIKTYCQLLGIPLDSDSPAQIASHLSSLANKATQLKPGDAAPPFKVTDINGQSLSLKKLEGKVVLLHFWATWCGPCMGQMDSLKEDLAKYSPDELAIVFVSLDYDQQAFEKTVTELELPGINVLSEAGVGGELPKAYGIRQLPSDVVIDSNKKVASNDIRDLPKLLKR